MIHHQCNQILSKKVNNKLNLIIQVNKEIIKFLIQYLQHLDGYKLTIKYANKFDIVSPAWFTIRYNNIIDGKQDINEQWMQQIKQKNPKILIIPRIHIELEQATIIEQINKPQLLETILNLLQQYQNQFDGIMIDTPYLSFVDTLSAYDLVAFLQKLKNKLNTKKHKLILTLYGNYGNQLYKHSTIKKIFKIADYTLIQTYDYQIQEEEHQLLAPYNWIQENLEYFMIYKEKLLFGIPFYGFVKTEKGINHILGNQILQLNPENYLSEWYSEISECVYSNEYEIISYPCPQFIKYRLDLIKEFDRGFFIWEGGQGLEIFYQML